MLPDIFHFDISAEERRAEYMNILCNDTMPVSANQVENEWRYYTGAVLEPLGWQAVWKLSPKECEQLSLPFPVSVFVVVESLDVEDFSATVNVLKTPANMTVPEKFSTSLLQLYPTINQVHDALYVKETAKCLDQMRFFYNQLWFPWDIEDDDAQDWVNAHLDKRLKLFYDMKSGKVPSDMVENIMSLLSEARKIQKQISALEEQIDDTDDEGSLDEKRACNLIQLRIRFHKIKKEIQVMENPALRCVLATRQTNPKTFIKKNRNEVSLVWHGGSLEDYIDILTKIKFHIGSETMLTPFPLLQEALDTGSEGDTILICPGVYGIHGASFLESGGKMKGFSSPEATVITAHDAGNVLIACAKTELFLENIKIDGRKNDITILVRSGVLRMVNCHIIGRENSSTSKGIVILGKGKVELQDCSIFSFGTALYINSEAEVSLTSCHIYSCHIGIQIFGGAKVLLHDSTVKKCKHYGIKCDTDNTEVIENEYSIGSDTLLTNVSEINLERTTIENNEKGDVIIMKNPNGKQFYDYFVNPPFYCTNTIKL